MRKLIAAINMTLDGFCDHTILIADDELHQHYTDLLNSAGDILYGRTTYQLMESYWPALVRNPSGNKSEDDFAVAIDDIRKILFSHTLRNVAWKNARLATKHLEEEVSALKQDPGPKDMLVGSPGLIVQAMNLNLIDEFQICVQPIIAGKGLPLLKDIQEKINLKLAGTKIFNDSGSIILYYKPEYRQ